jgi:hypothetical protein
MAAKIMLPKHRRATRHLHWVSRSCCKPVISSAVRTVYNLMGCAQKHHGKAEGIGARQPKSYTCRHPGVRMLIIIFLATLPGWSVTPQPKK